MRIAELTAYQVRIPLKTRIRHASHSRDATDSIVIRCRLEDGTTGWGEGLPRSYVTGETIDDVWPLLRATPLSQQLGARFETLAEAIALCEELRLTRPQPDPRDCFGNSVRCAIELAILDAACRTLQVPLSEITAKEASAVAIRGHSDSVRYSGVITSMSPFKQRLKAFLFRLNGFEQCKVKVGTDGVDDAASLRRVRAIVGPRVDLRIDANEAWTCEELPSRLEPLLPFGITSVEQPVRHEDILELTRLRPHLSVPVMLDESLCSLEDARLAIECGTCDLFNIRLSKCGGFVPSLRIAAAAHRAGLSSQLGCQVGETGILSAAGRHFATSVAHLRYLEGSYDRYLVRERLTQEDLTFRRYGEAPALTGPGLGVTLDEPALRRVTVAEERFAIA